MSYNMRVIYAFVVCFTVVTAASNPSDVSPRIVGGTEVNIGQWPQMANVLFAWNSVLFEPHCGGVILSEQTILTSAHCISFQQVSRYRLRIASASLNTGGSSINVAGLIPHPFYNPITEDHDFGLIRTAITLNYTTQIRPATIADAGYNLRDNEVVHAIGWGAVEHGGNRSEHLRAVQIFTINQNTCARHYSTENIVITDNMLCAGWLDVGGRGQCQGDTGGPLFHNNVLVGIYSFGINCGTRFYPSVNARVSRVSDWINANK